MFYWWIKGVAILPHSLFTSHVKVGNLNLGPYMISPAINYVLGPLHT